MKDFKTKDKEREDAVKKIIVLGAIFIGFLSFEIFNPMVIFAQEKAKTEKGQNEGSVYKKIEELTGAKGTLDEKESVSRSVFPAPTSKSSRQVSS